MNTVVVGVASAAYISTNLPASATNEEKTVPEEGVRCHVCFYKWHSHGHQKRAPVHTTQSEAARASAGSEQIRVRAVCAYYFGGHYIDQYRKGEASTSTWGAAFKSSLFLLNMLYLAVTGKTLILFNCQPLGDGTQYLVAAPGAKCFQGDHLISLVLAALPLFVDTS